ncbi:hypothetical protein GCM10027275_30700 [Rhabdobacter roseus]|uniref:Uncharacterized protein n=1 Tax=Rhabdobacter roseus TaxID=1655419 RepID=A0A840TXV6_9BACT|nr:hypothetical protein [Rhabdobacter roseus]MBB5285028.1 hypothetical protein [Rhabdobacter roseus]
MKYSAFRITINQSRQTSLFGAFSPHDPVVLDKKELLAVVVNKFEKSTKFTFEHKNKKFLVYFIKRIDGRTYLLQIAREDLVNQPKEGETHIETEETTIVPFVHFILDIDTQIILIQERSSVFKETRSAANRILDAFVRNLTEYNVEVEMNSITHVEDFWAEVENAQKIYSLSIDIMPPNLFGSRFRSAIDVKEVHEETNFKKFRIYFANKLGRLRIKRKEFSDLLRTVASGGGDYALQIINDIGDRVKITKDIVIQALILPDEVEDINYLILRNELDKIDRLNDYNLGGNDEEIFTTLSEADQKVDGNEGEQMVDDVGSESVDPENDILEKQLSLFPKKDNPELPPPSTDFDALEGEDPEATRLLPKKKKKDD